MTRNAMILRVAAVLIAAVIAVIVIGCGDGESDTPAAKATGTAPGAASRTIASASTPASAASSSSGAASLDPCSFVTRSEAEAAFGLPAQAPEAKGPVCHYDTVQQTKFFDLTARVGTSKDFESTKNLCGDGTEPVPGLGDHSCSTNNTVVVLAKDVLIYIIAGGNFNQDNLKTLAETAVTRVR